MSSSSPNRPSPETDKPIVKRAPGACAECRRKRGDKATRAGSKCTNCAIADVECVSVASQKPLLQRQREYIRILETRVNRLENYIQALFPGEDIETVISKPPPTDKDRVASHSSSPLVKESLVKKDHVSGGDPPESLGLADEEDIEHVALVKQLGSLNLTPSVIYRFFGAASPFMAAKQAATLKSMHTGIPDTGVHPKNYRRPLYWGMSSWESEWVTSPPAPYIYPDFDLMLDLVQIYFQKTNSLFPIIHEPTFMKGIMSGKHYGDQSFGMTVLLVCANGARYSKDPRVIFAPDAAGSEFSAGWHYFSQVPFHRRIMLYTPTVYDLQYYALAAVYLTGSSMCPVSCNLVGIGLRYAIEMGAHRRNGQDRPTADTEHMKRAFWALFCLDSIDSSFYGRPSGISHESIDIEYPVECDDEYWEHPNPAKAFKQPAGIPCKISSFIHLIKLCEVLGFASRTLYSTYKSKLLSGYLGGDWEIRMVAEIDSSLNKWKLSLPAHLVWDPHREDMLHFQQSAHLHYLLAYIQIQSHRLFLTRQSSLSFASLAMCTSAARSCGHIQEAAIARDLRILPQTIVRQDHPFKIVCH
ncbi:Putative transcriptional regulatory protein [Psilocybe cubensis]|uniref:Transcriptional regulatory protein n=1 Tax=Psilocybe cubensis TaxID=181762 RepID=A0ACB8GU95_PSICU|nr:Putative transcriptional regulatory protein [Psilocybe cubensis]KAH9479055.1 Putative transcriptional regulatory protein [Psilocybe cubensis]